jgi:hypothetical protein
MKKRYLYVLPLALILGAYSSNSYGQVDCEEPEPINNDNCEGVAQAPAIHIDLNNKNVTPRCAVANRGTTIVIMFTPRNDLERDTLEVFPKNPSDFWLRGTNDEVEHLIIIEVPRKPDDEKDSEIPPTYHDFGIRTPDWCIDPRIKVEH